MVSKIVLVTGAANVLFIGAGILELVFALIFQARKDNAPTTGEEAVRGLLYDQFPLTAVIANAALIFATAILGVLPALLMPTNRGWLKLAGYAVLVCAVFTLCIGVFLWVMTLKMGDDFTEIYLDQTSDIQALMQTSFECCGYLNSTMPAFVTNPTCPSPAAAALLRGCKTAISSFGNSEIDQIFTAVFGVVGVDVLFILAITCLHKHRKDLEWYHLIDQKKIGW